MKHLELAIKAAKEAGKVLLENFGKQHQIKEKSLHDFVTDVDIKAEKVILNMIKKTFQEHSILSEEAGVERHKPEYLWVVDPLDGTTNYTVGNPFFDVSIALAKKSGNFYEPVVGVVYSPVTKELFTAEKGKGAFFNEKRINVSQESNIPKLMLVYCHGNTKESINEIIKIFGKIKPLARDFNRMRAGALELAFVAAGRLGGFISPGGYTWDNAAGALLVKEAGGKVTDFSGRNWVIDIKSSQKDILATNGKVHQKILKIIKE